MDENRSSTVTVLGCGGFIGSHLLERLLQDTDLKIVGVDITVRKIHHLLTHKRLSVHRMDIHDAARLRPYIEKSGTVISLAALCNPYLYNHNPISVIESNFLNVYPLVQACTELNCKLVHFSTSEVYGRTLASTARTCDAPYDPSLYILDETSTPLLLGPVHFQRWSYACAKQLLERAIYAYGFERGLDYTIVRPFNFIGPRMDFIPGIDGEGVPRVIACFMEALLHGKPLRLVDGGSHRRCFTAISDAIDATIRIIERPQVSSRRIFNIGNPSNEITIAGLAECMIGLYGEICGEAARSGIESVSSREFYGEGYQDSDRRVPEISAASHLLDWNPSVDLVDALRITIEGFVGMYRREKRARSSRDSGRV